MTIGEEKDIPSFVREVLRISSDAQSQPASSSHRKAVLYDLKQLCLIRSGLSSRAHSLSQVYGHAHTVPSRITATVEICPEFSAQGQLLGSKAIFRVCGKQVYSMDFEAYSKTNLSHYFVCIGSTRSVASTHELRVSLYDLKMLGAARLLARKYGIQSFLARAYPDPFLTRFGFSTEPFDSSE